MQLLDRRVDDVRVFDDLPVHIGRSTLGLSDNQEVWQTAQAPCGFLLGDPFRPVFH